MRHAVMVGMGIRLSAMGGDPWDALQAPYGAFVWVGYARGPTGPIAEPYGHPTRFPGLNDKTD